MFIKSTTIFLAVLLTFCSFSGMAFAQTAEQQYNAGMTSFSMQQYTSAIDQWKRLLTSYPDYAEKEKVWYSIASAALRIKNYEEATTYFSKIVDQKDANNQPVRGVYYEESLYQIGLTLFNNAEQLRLQGDLTNAKTYATNAKIFFDRLYTERPNSTNTPMALSYLTKIAVMYMQNASETQKYGQLALEKIPNDTANQELRKDCEFYYAWALGQLGRETEARQIFSGLISAGGERGATSLLELAYTYYQKGDAQRALNELQRFESLFSNNTSSRLGVLRLRARCYYQLEDYTQANNLLNQMVETQQASSASVPVEDYIYLVLCYIKLREFQRADQFIAYYLEGPYSNSTFSDGIKIVRAAYHYGMQDYQKAIDIINPILGTQQQTGTGMITFTRRPFNAETTDQQNKCGLSEEHFLRAASLLAKCYARMGHRTVGEQVYNAMYQISNELYGRFASIREETLQELSQIAQTQPPGGTTGGTTTGTGISPPSLGGGSIAGGVTPPAIGSGTGSSSGGLVTGGSVVSGSQTSTIQTGGNNSLANRVMTPEEQDKQINQCETRAKNGFEDDVINELQLLITNPNLTNFNHARVFLLRGHLLYKKGEKSNAFDMFEMAYEYVPTDQRDTKIFTGAAYYMGKYAEMSGNYADAARYYEEALKTTAGGQGEYRYPLLYRWGTSQMNVPGERGHAIWCFEQIYKEDKTSEYWSHAALQMAIADHKDGAYERCEKIIDELIAFKPDKSILDRVLYLKGDLAMRNKQWNIAIESLDALCVYTPSSPFVALAAQKLSDARSRSTQSTIR